MANHQIAVDVNIPALSYEAGGRDICIDSSGRLWVVYTKRPILGLKEHIHVAYSDDGGVTWTEEQVTGAIDQHHFFAAIAIDSLDIPHLVYWSTGRAPFATRWGVFYTNRTGGAWIPEETVALLNVANPGQDYPSMAIDSWDNVHVAWVGLGWGVNTTIANIEYRKRTFAGVWGVTEQVTDKTGPQDEPCIAIDTSDNVHISWRGKDWGVNTTFWQVAYGKGPTIWATENVTDNVGWNNFARLALDSSDKPHIVWYDATADIVYYTKKTGVGWLAPEQVSQVGETISYGYPHIALDQSNAIHVCWSMYGPGQSITWVNVWYRKKTTSWLPAKFITNQDTADHYAVSLLWAMWPQIGGVRTNILPGLQKAVWAAEGEAVWFGITPAYAGGGGGGNQADLLVKDKFI